jgi:pilus assembly protein CpaB
MKKNLVPLVVIALVVAVVSTGIFYGLIVSRMDGSPKAAMVPRYVAASALEKGHVLKTQDFRLTNVAASGIRGPQTADELEGRTLLEAIEAGQEFQDATLSPIANRPLPGGIPAGQRAVTVHITEASSVVQMLKTGDRVDVQALVARNRNGENDLDLKTILQNATVFTIASVQASVENGGPGQGRSILTLLASPQDAERLTLADAGARLRVVLRNKNDKEVLPLNTLQLSNLTVASRMSSGFAVNKPVNKSVETPAEKAMVSSQFLPVAPRKQSPVELQVELVEVASEDAPAFAPAARDGVLQVSTTSLEANAVETMKQLRAGQKVRVLASARLIANRTGEFAWKSDSGEKNAASLHLKVESNGASDDGTWQLQLHPESSSPKSGATATRRVESTVSLTPKQSAVVSGLFSAEEVAKLRQAMPNSDAQSKGEWMLIVSPKASNTSAAVVAPKVAQR